MESFIVIIFNIMFHPTWRYQLHALTTRYINQRGCLFRNELLKYGGSYGRSQCVAACRIRSMLALCKCVPFFMVTTGTVASDRSITICNLQHVACLNKYKSKYEQFSRKATSGSTMRRKCWATYKSHRHFLFCVFSAKWSTVITDYVQIPAVEKEMEESLYCPDCLPSCSDIKYQLSASEMPLPESTRTEYRLTLVKYELQHDNVITCKASSQEQNQRYVRNSPSAYIFRTIRFTAIQTRRGILLVRDTVQFGWHVWHPGWPLADKHNGKCLLHPQTDGIDFADHVLPLSGAETQSSDSDTVFEVNLNARHTRASCSVHKRWVKFTFNTDYRRCSRSPFTEPDNGTIICTGNIG